MSDCFDHAGQAGAQPLGLHATCHTSETRGGLRRKRTSPEYNWTADILPQDDVGGFLIQSEADPGTYYKVDLMAYNGEGRCTCDDYTTRVECWRRREIKPVHRCCKHIRMALEFLGREIITKLSLSARRQASDRFKVVNIGDVQGPTTRKSKPCQTTPTTTSRTLPKASLTHVQSTHTSPLSHSQR